MSIPDLPVLVESARLEQHLGDAGLLILDMRPGDRYAAGHIPGAVNLDYASIIRVSPPAMGLLPDEAQLSAVLSRIGLTADTGVVAYDDEGGGRAGRLLWTLDALGHQHLSLLNGGIRAWAAERRALEQGVREPRPSRYAAHLGNPVVVADKDYILSRLGKADLIMLDTRSPGEYQGSDVRAARGGHIPGAVNMNWTDAMDVQRDLRLKPDATLHDMLAKLGATPAKEIIVYCQTHHRSAHTYMVLKHLGFGKVRGYPGAWSEWGNDPTLPVE